MNGKTCLITGGTLGMGKESALALAAMGAHVIIVGRDAVRTQAVVQEIQGETGNSKVEGLVADLSSLSEVRRLGQLIRSRFNRLDILMNNAGAIFTEYKKTPEGFERTWALNHLAYFSLTLELLELLKASAPSRIINIASDMHKIGRLETTSSPQTYNGHKAYANSKLANIMFTYALARRLEGTGVTVNCVHPGPVATGFAQNNSGFFKWAVLLAKPFLLSAKKGAETGIYLASSPDVAGTSGKYFAKCRPKSSSKISYDVSLQEKLWAESLEQINRVKSTFQSQPQ